MKLMEATGFLIFVYNVLNSLFYIYFEITT